MIKVICIELNPNCWDKKSDETKFDSERQKYINSIWYECPALEKFISEGWKIKEWKMSEHDAIFIMEKRDRKK